MPELIDTKGLGCAEPVIMAKKALESHDEITLIVDARTALENIKALARTVQAASQGFEVRVDRGYSSFRRFTCFAPECNLEWRVNV